MAQSALQILGKVRPAYRQGGQRQACSPAANAAGWHSSEVRGTNTANRPAFAGLLRINPGSKLAAQRSPTPRTVKLWLKRSGLHCDPCQLEGIGRGRGQAQKPHDERQDVALESKDDAPASTHRGVERILPMASLARVFAANKSPNRAQRRARSFTICPLPKTWAKKSNFASRYNIQAGSRETMDDELLEQAILASQVLDDYWIATGSLNVFKALMGSLQPTKQLLDEIRSVIRLLLEFEFINEGDLEEHDLPELPKVLIDTKRCRIFVTGETGRIKKLAGSTARWIGVVDIEVWVESYQDMTVLRYRPSIIGEVLPYFALNVGAIKRNLPNLGRYLRRYKLFEGSDWTTLQRLVAAADGQRLGRDVDVHHTRKASGTWYGGHSTLDCRARVLEVKQRGDHIREHMKPGSGPHYYTKVKRSQTVMVLSQPNTGSAGRCWRGIAQGRRVAVSRIS